MIRTEFELDPEYVYGLSWLHYLIEDGDDKPEIKYNGGIWEDYKWYVEFDNNAVYEECISELDDCNYPEEFHETLMKYGKNIETTYDKD